MCYNKNISLITFSIMIISSIILFKRNYQNDRWFAIIFIFAGLMQLSEFFMWMDQKCGITNHLASLSAYLVLLLQPISILIGCYFFGKTIFDKKKLIPIIILYSIVFGISAFIGIFYSFKYRLCSKPDGIHLSWNLKNLYPPKFLFYLIFILYYLSIFLLLFSKHKFSSIFIFILYIGTLIFSVFLVKNPSWKSFWCWIVNLIPIAYLSITSF